MLFGSCRSNNNSHTDQNETDAPDTLDVLGTPGTPDDSDPVDNNFSKAKTITQYGITWTFSEPAAYGRFINGDYWVVGPVDVADINPRPGNGRNGSAVNLNLEGKDYTNGKACWDDRISSGRYTEDNLITLPYSLKSSHSLISTISNVKNDSLTKMFRNESTDIPVRTAAVLTCLEKPVSSASFRPGYADPEKKIYLYSNLRRDLLPKKSILPSNMPVIADFERYLERPWLDIAYDEFTAPPDNMPVYGREYTRVVSIAALLLCLDLPDEQKETLLIRLVQIGIDLRGLIKAGFYGWPAIGGHGNGRKLPLLLAGLLLNEEDMQHPDIFYPKAIFSEDIQTMYDTCWTGATVVFAGHAGADGCPNHNDWGAYEHLHPAHWPGTTGETYRRCCTSIAWVGEATAAKLFGLKEIWNHDAFFDYVYRWMTEDDKEFSQIAAQETGVDFTQGWAAQGQAWDKFVEEMWDLYW